MAYWGKIIGGVAGFAMGGPAGAIFGATLGHAADTGRLPRWGAGGQTGWPGGGRFGLPFPPPLSPATLPGGREQMFSLGVVTLAAKLAKSDGPVNRAEIAAFRSAVPVPPEAVATVGQLFDQARAHPGGQRKTAADGTEHERILEGMRDRVGWKAGSPREGGGDCLAAGRPGAG